MANNVSHALSPLLAVLNQIGTWSSGFFTVTIAVHTFNSLVLKRKQPLIVSRCLMAVGWIVSGVMGKHLNA
jgi:hypothetical protein